MILLLLAFVAVASSVWPRAHSGLVVSIILAVLWAWMGIAYHLLFFSRINPLAFAFAAISILGSLAFLWWGVLRRQVRIERPSGWRAWAAGLLLAYALAVYPALSWLSGHPYQSSPTFGLPCPTTIFTIGVLMFMAAPFPRMLFAAPLLWSLIGGQAAFLLEMPQDLGLLAAGLAGAIFVICPRPGPRQ